MLKHKVQPGQTLSLIAAFCSTTVQQLAQVNDIAKEVSDDNDLTDAELMVHLPLTENTLDEFDRGYDSLASLVAHTGDNMFDDQNLDQLYAYLDQCIEDIYQRLLMKEAGYPQAIVDLHIAHSAWNYFCTNDGNWGMSMCYKDHRYRGVKGSIHNERPVGLNRAAIMKARVEQLYANEVEFDSRMKG